MEQATEITPKSQEKLDMDLDWFLLVIYWRTDVYIRQIDSMLPYISSVKEHSCQNVGRTSLTFSCMLCATYLFLSYFRLHAVLPYG